MEKWGILEFPTESESLLAILSNFANILRLVLGRRNVLHRQEVSMSSQSQVVGHTGEASPQSLPQGHVNLVRKHAKRSLRTQANRQLAAEILRRVESEYRLSSEAFESDEFLLPDTIAPFVVGDAIVFTLNADVVVKQAETVAAGAPISQIVFPIREGAITEAVNGFALIFETGAVGPVSVRFNRDPSEIEFLDPLDLIDPDGDEAPTGSYQVALIQLKRPEDHVHVA